MKKTSKFLSAILMMVMIFAMATPAFASVTYTGNQLNPKGNWGNGPSLTLTNVTKERVVPMDLHCCYDVEVGGSLVLDMPFPAGENRNYRIFASGVYISPDFTTYAPPLENWDMPTWDLPAASQGDTFHQSSGKSQYVYNFTASDMGQAYGCEKVIYMDIYWDTDPDGDGYTNDSGSAYFYIHVVPAGSTSTTTTVQPGTSSAGTNPAPGVSVLASDGSGEFLYTIKPGDTLSGLAAYYYGNANVYKLIYELNKDTIKNVNMIYAGQTIRLPSYPAVARGVARI